MNIFLRALALCLLSVRGVSLAERERTITSNEPREPRNRRTSLTDSPRPPDFDSCDCTSSYSCTSNEMNRVYGILETPTETPDLDAYVNYVDTNVCPILGSVRAGIETVEELQFLVSCVLCGTTDFGSSKNKTNILTAGFISVQHQQPNAQAVLALEKGIWTSWNTSVTGNVPSKAVLVNGKTGMGEPENSPVPPGNYSVLLMGNSKQICTPTEDTYKTWGLLSHNKSYSYLPGIVACEKILPVTTHITSNHYTPSYDFTMTTNAMTTNATTTTATTTTTSTTTSTITTRLPSTAGGCCPIQVRRLRYGMTFPVGEIQSHIKTK